MESEDSLSEREQPLSAEETSYREAMLEYRKHLVLAEQKSQETYDKAVLSLSGTALGVSFAFIDKFLTLPTAEWRTLLYAAWSCWGVSITLILASHFFSQKALRNAIIAVDSNRIHDKRPGGIFTMITAWLNGLAGLLFAIGVVAMIVFVAFNSVHEK